MNKLSEQYHAYHFYRWLYTRAFPLKYHCIGINDILEPAKKKSQTKKPFYLYEKCKEGSSYLKYLKHERPI